MSKEIPLRELKILDSKINESIKHLMDILSGLQVNYEDQGIENYMHQYLEEIYGFNCEVIENNGFSYVIPNKI